jgi:hypothetical protein
MMNVPRRVRQLVAAFLAIFGLARAAGADELWIASTYQVDVGGFGIGSNVVWPATAIGSARFALAVPNNLQTFQSAKVLLIPHRPGGAATLNVIVCAAESGQAAAGNCTGPVPYAFTGVVNQLLEIDISTAVASTVGAPGLNNLAIVAYTTPTTGTDHLVGLRFAYTPTPPTGVATLAANTFTGTQTAPAFVGDGSGLTNLSAPSGVATLGPNIFGGTQTAPAFIGDGTGLTNVNASLLVGLSPAAFATAAHGHDVSQITNAATLSTNTFLGSQVIDAGNLDLDNSLNSMRGNITRNGQRFLP